MKYLLSILRYEPTCDLCIDLEVGTSDSRTVGPRTELNVNRESMHFQKIQSFCKHPPHTMATHALVLKRCLHILFLLLYGTCLIFFSISFSQLDQSRLQQGYRLTRFHVMAIVW